MARDGPNTLKRSFRLVGAYFIKYISPFLRRSRKIEQPVCKPDMCFSNNPNTIRKVSMERFELLQLLQRRIIVDFRNTIT